MFEQYECGFLELFFLCLTVFNTIGLERWSQTCLSGDSPCFKAWVGLTLLQVLLEKSILQPLRQRLLAKVRFCLTKVETDFKATLQLDKLSNKTAVEQLNQSIQSAIHSFGTFVCSCEGMVSPLCVGIYFFIQMGLTNPLVFIFPLGGYLVWLISFKVLPKQQLTDYKLWDDLWGKVWHYREVFFDNAIHSLASENCSQECELFKKIDQQDLADEKASGLETTRVILSFAAVLIPIAFLINTDDIPIVVLVKNFTVLITMSNSVSGIYQSWMTYTKNRLILDEKKKEFGSPEEIVPPIPIGQSIRIKELNYSNGDGFNLKLQQSVELLRGKAYLLDGKSGSGKSTFCDFIGGIISTSLYLSFVAFTDNIRLPSFKCFNHGRVYITQEQNVSKTVSIFDTVAGIHSDKHDPIQKKNVRQALRLAYCHTFCDLDGSSSDKKDIFADEPTFSGGEERRIAVARSIYRVLRMSSVGFVIIDEIDAAIQQQMAIDIMKGLLKYLCEERKAMVLVCAHTEAIKQDASLWHQKLSFDGGKVTIDKVKE